LGYCSHTFHARIHFQSPPNRRGDRETSSPLPFPLRTLLPLLEYDWTLAPPLLPVQTSINFWLSLPDCNVSLCSSRAGTSCDLFQWASWTAARVSNFFLPGSCFLSDASSASIFPEMTSAYARRSRFGLPFFLFDFDCRPFLQTIFSTPYLGKLDDSQSFIYHNG